EDDSKLKVLKDRLLELLKDGQVVLFTYYADTLNYIYNEILKDKRFFKLNIEAISSSGLTSKNPQQREKIVQEFFDKKINLLMSTDVLSEGQNLQTAKYLINYDLHWNPTRMIQRAGRIDRIGSPFKKIFVYNFFPEDELEELLKLVEILQNKIIDIDKSVGLDQTILGEEIHPKVFGIIRRIRSKDEKLFAELESDMFGGGEMFYQPLKDFLKNKGVEELEKIPYGIFSGLRKGKASGIFFYYKYGNDFHFWHLYDVSNGSITTNKTTILEFIKCKTNEKRVIPDFFDKIYEINRIVVEDIERSYKEIELSHTQDSKLKELSKSASTKFVKNMINEIEIHINSYLEEYPSDTHIEKTWEPIKNKLISIPQTKKRLQNLRKIWRQYKKDGDWKKMITELGGFLIEKGVFKKTVVESFDKSKLKLVTIDFISQ
ncbi:MAG: C-terminal helicase domain-containing protein, partial [Candidatus Nitrosotenuis sp.]